MIYFIQAGDGGAIKIGFSNNPWQRSSKIQSDCPQVVTLLAVIEGDEAAEASLHDRFNDARRVGEWFEPTDALTAFIASLDCIARVRGERQRKRLPGQLGAYLYEHGLTLHQFASRIGISHAQLSRIISAPGFLPSLVTAWRIEAETQGRVPMQYWCRPEAKAKAA